MVFSEVVGTLSFLQPQGKSNWMLIMITVCSRWWHGRPFALLLHDNLLVGYFREHIFKAFLKTEFYKGADQLENVRRTANWGAKRMPFGFFDFILFQCWMPAEYQSSWQEYTGFPLDAKLIAFVPNRNILLLHEHLLCTVHGDNPPGRGSAREEHDQLLPVDALLFG